MNARTANKIHQQRLDCIVTMMGNTYLSGFNIAPKLLEIAVTQLTSSHFNAHLMDAGISNCIEMTYMKRNAMFVTERYDELLVAVGLSAAQAKVAVDSLDLVAETPEDEQ